MAESPEIFRPRPFLGISEILALASWIVIPDYEDDGFQPVGFRSMIEEL